MEDIKGRWTHLYHDHLPALAKARDPVQKRWPVHLDHCFARIILDNAIGVEQPWTHVLKSPAIKHMTEGQLRAAIDLADEIATGEADLNTLNDRSLQLRGKMHVSKKRENAHGTENKPATKKPKQDSATISSYFLPSPSTSPSSQVKATQVNSTAYTEEHTEQPAGALDMSKELQRITASELTPFRKQTLTLLCQIPPGRYSTYQAMSDHITKISHKTCARAVGNAMRNNPFAPEVPCHRILAADGSLGGFGGHWGETGRFANKKHELLHKEGVLFDSRGKVKGPVFRDFVG